MKNIKIPARFKAFVLFALVNTAIFTFARIVFFFINNKEQLPAANIAKAFFIGLRFDIRIAFIFALPLGIVFLFPAVKWLKKATAFVYSLAFGGFTLLYFVDFGYYAYLTERLNAYIIELAANTTTSAEMVWESYPVITGSIVLLVIIALYYLFMRKLIVWAFAAPARKKDYWYALPALLIAAAFVHGKFSQYPLRWSDAYFSNDSFVSSLALNPVQNLVDTYRFAEKGATFDENKTREYYNEVADFLGVTDKDAQKLNFQRNIPQAKEVKKYNIVFILTESLSFDKTSFNNPDLDTTPYLKEFSKKGKLFTRCFSPAAGTAKGVFATVTGLPDTSTVKTSSRNPLIVKQHTLIDDLEGYKKFYFIGGSTSWGNIRGLLQYNIKDLNIFEEGTYKDVHRNDVWGLSDLDMFRYAAKELGETKEPFFAILQTAGFHRPYTIPEDKGDFKLDKKDDNFLKERGFPGGNEQYNSMRFQDYAMGQFFELAQKEPFFKNTIFFIYGDHGLTVQESKNAPKGIVDLELTTNNIPLVVVGPGIAPGVDDKPASQVDLTATMAGLLGSAYRETALGRNLFDDKITRGAFILAGAGAPLRVGYIEGDFYYTYWPLKKGMFKYKSDDSTTDYCPQYPQQCEKMQKLAQGLYEASRYITFHHK